MEINCYYFNLSNNGKKILPILKRIVMIAIIAIFTNHNLFAQAPAAPVATAATNFTCTSFNANWGAVSGAVTYYIDVSTDPLFGIFEPGYNDLATGNVLTYNITGLTVNTNYYYRVRVSDGSNTSLNSNTITANTGSSAPNALSASNVTCTSFDANWSAVTGATQYFLDVSTSASFATFVTSYNNLNAGNVTTFNVTGLSVNNTYYYRVRSGNGCTTSSNSNSIMAGTSYPTLSSSLTPPAICSGSAFSYTPTSATSGATFSWTRAVVGGISNPSSSGSGNPNEVLTNTTANPVNVTYTYTVSANGCNNPNTFSVVVTVNPTPTINSSLTPPAICGGTAFNYTPTSATSGATFSWTRATVTGINEPASSGAGDPNEVLTNTTANPVNVTYVYSVSANGCTNSSTYSVVVTVNPAPTLSSSLTPPAICGGTTFSYTPTSATSGATFSWTRAVVAGISEPSSSGAGDPNEVLTNTTAYPVNVTYTYTVSANGCTNPNTLSVVVTVNAIPTLASSLTPPAIFTDHIFNYTPTSGTTGTTFSWTRTAVTGISNPSGSGTDDPNEALFNTTTNPVNVTYVYTLSANGCTNSTSYSVVVTVNTPAVWPGDANNDSLVNNIDLLSIGLHYSETGTPRANIDNTWQANIATNWGTLQTNGQDVKHADCNGDGTVDSNDTLAINLNFNLTHTIVPPPVDPYQERTTSDMYFVISSSAYNAGDWVDIELWLGSQSTPISDFYGIAFNINYEASLVQTGTEAITYTNSWLGTPGTDVLTITKADALANTAYGAVTRIDHTGKSGYGKIADFKFQIKNVLTAEDTMYFSISGYKAVDSAGTLLTLSSGTDSISVSPLSTGIETKKVESIIGIAPNPFTSATTITMNSEIKNSTVKIVDVLGKEVKTISFSGKKLVLEKGELSAGIYSVKIISEQKTIIANEKIIIQ